MTDTRLRAHAEEIWRDVLQVEINDDTDFFDFGGHSFVALRIIAMLDDRHGIRLPARVLFENPRFGDFVAALGTAPATNGSS
ncbi:phosphopantetheine-binding protein [Streptomyces sp. LZ34]